MNEGLVPVRLSLLRLMLGQSHVMADVGASRHTNTHKHTHTNAHTPHTSTPQHKQVVIVIAATCFFLGRYKLICQAVIGE